MAASKKAAPEVRIGISGWRYPPWRGTFYPRDLPQRRELEYASRQVRSIELNGSFYSLQNPASYHAWREATPEDFVFAVKGGRFITHMKRLKSIEAPLANFFASGVLRLNEKLGPILWQLPPQFVYERERLESFFRLLPRDSTEAAALARRHDERLRARAWTRIDRARPLRHAIEVRHPSFQSAEFVALLREHGVALVVADTAGKWPLMEDLTADFVYARLHGDEELYVSGYTNAALRDWARKIRAWRDGKNPRGARLHAPPLSSTRNSAGRGGCEVYVYFDNDVKVRAPYDAMTLAHLLRLGPKPPAAPDVAGILEIARTRWPGFTRRASRRGAAAARRR